MYFGIFSFLNISENYITNNKYVDSKTNRSLILVAQPINHDGTLPKPLDSYYEFVYNGNKVTLSKKIDNYDIPYYIQQRELLLDQKDRIIGRIVGNDTIDFSCQSRIVPMVIRFMGFAETIFDESLHFAGDGTEKAGLLRII